MDMVECGTFTLLSLGLGVQCEQPHAVVLSSLITRQCRQHVCRRSESSCHDEVFAACLQNPLESSYDSEGSSVLSSNYLSLGT